MKNYLSLALMAIGASSFAGTGNVAVWATGESSPSFVTDFLTASGLFNTVSSITTGNAATVDLSVYDRVLYYSNNNGGGQDPTAIGNKLADFADSGKRLVICTFSFASQGVNTLGGRIMTAGYSPFQIDGQSLYTYSTLGVTDGSGFWTGVNALNNGNRDKVSVVSGATTLGSYNDGRVLLARQGNILGLNLFPNGSYQGVNGDYKQLVENTLTVDTNAVPEPATMAILGLGVLALRKRRARK